MLRYVRGEGVFVDDGFIKEKTFENLRLRYNFFFCFSKRKSCKKKTSLGDFDFPPGTPLKAPKKTASVFLELSRVIWSSSKALTRFKEGS